MMRTAPWTLDSFKLSDDMQVRMLGKDVAVVAYQVHEELTVEGKPVTLDAADSSTWVRRLYRGPVRRPLRPRPAVGALSA